MSHIGLICPELSGHLYQMTTLGRELKRRGHRVTVVAAGCPAEGGSGGVGLCGDRGAGISRGGDGGDVGGIGAAERIAGDPVHGGAAAARSGDDFAGRAFDLVDLRLPKAREPVNEETFSFSLNRQKLRVARRREGRYLLRSNLCEQAPGKLWEFYM